MKTHILQTSFVAGMIDPLAQARSETALYRNGASAIRNGLPLATGGVLSRWGMQHLEEYTHGLGVTYRIEEFSFSLDQSYIVVFFAESAKMYFADDGAPAGALGAMPWTESMIPELRFAQAGDTMFVTHPDMATVVIRRIGATTFTGGAMAFTGGYGPTYRYEDPAISCTYVAAGATLTFSTGFMTAAHLGTILRIYDVTNSVYRYASINAITTSAICSLNWLEASAQLTDGNVTRAWEEQAFSGAHGYARSACIYQQRLVLGGSRDAGDAVWMSRIGRYYDFDLGTGQDTEAIAIALGTTRVRSIQHTVAGPQLTFLTESAAVYMPETDTRPLTPASLPKVRVIAAIGAGNVRPGTFDGGILMVQATGNSVRDVAYSDATENLVADPVSMVVTDSLGTLIDAAYLPGSQDRPEQYAFFVTSDGRLMLFHSIREQRITAWAEWVTDGEFKAVGQSSGYLFAVVVREGTARLERFDETLAFDASVVGAVPFVAAHLPEKAIHARFGDDYFGSGDADAGGAVEVTRQLAEAGGLEDGQVAELGLAFDFWIDPLPPSMELPNGSLIGRIQRMLRCGVRLYQARAASIGAVQLTLREADFLVADTPPNADGWWSIPVLGYARRDDQSQLMPRLGRAIPMPVGILAMRREIVLWE